jgi:pimeloyl-ACP methyl ester carboxylesterase
MTTATSVVDHEPAGAREQSTTGVVTSKVGTTIRYCQLGHGPGVVMLHGAMESARSHMQLARALADAYTVYLPDRRGHQLSGNMYYSMQQEVDDLGALLAATDTQNVFGVSAGGLICLQAALTLPSIHKVAVYEPALIVDGSISTAFLPRYDAEMAQGKVAAALVTAMTGAQMGPAIFNHIPRWLLERLTNMAMKSEEKKTKDGDVTMRMLAPTLHYDFQLVAEMAETLETFTALRADVLLLGGGKSPAYLKRALDALEKVVPHVRRIEFPALGHGGSSDASSTNRGGNPALVAQELRRFFA